MPGNKLPNKIVRYPDPGLRRKCPPVESFDEDLGVVARRMLELMRLHNGVGLAGPQVGINRRLFVCNPSGQSGDDRVYVNPEISELVGAVEAEEGCLSVPEVRVMIRRARQCRLKAQDLQGKPIEMNVTDLLARICQHEIDHLDGRLIVDRMNATDKVVNKKQIAQLEVDYKRGKPSLLRM